MSVQDIHYVIVTLFHRWEFFAEKICVRFINTHSFISTLSIVQRNMKVCTLYTSTIQVASRVCLLYNSVHSNNYSVKVE